MFVTHTIDFHFNLFRKKLKEIWGLLCVSAIMSLERIEIECGKKLQMNINVWQERGKGEAVSAAVDEDSTSG